jgi:hypothetical protein
MVPPVQKSTIQKILQLILICLSVHCIAQPTGHSKIFLEITDNGDTLHFENSFKKKEQGWKTSLTYKTYELKDISHNQTGFEFYPRAEYLHKTLMTRDHHIQIVKNKTDTMSVEILNAYKVYFLNIPFQKGNFKLFVNDGNLHKWNYITLPFKTINTEQIVFDITPTNWDVFQVDNRKLEVDYFISVQFAKQKLLAKPIIPEDDPNFRNPRRIQNLIKEVADFNFDGQKDYREHKINDSTKWNYFIYKDSISGFALDTLLSSLDLCYFNFENKKFIGSKTTRIDSLSTQTNVYEYIDKVLTLVQQRLCVQAFPNSEKSDCFIRVLENGKWVDKEPILGAE